ncbi:UNVERIFIED_CONTAM: Retrovirus-related Pol polyprotein from transposon TNT 1-94 [Sesamum calycinum]|uniref:Retrovirus-related Pol polyprotein from transposon TNT 1-94 n=1 Tax=Sesamum calycinum TaxID=2727403 RepID=A0AAW2J0C3_9LAMI
MAVTCIQTLYLGYGKQWLSNRSTSVNDFIKNEYDPYVYKKISGSSVAYLVLYVNDILLIGNDVKMLGDIKPWLSTQFSIKNMGKASYILGIKIYRDRSRRMLGLTQSPNIEKILKRFKMENSKRGFLSMRHGIKLYKKQSPKADEELRRMLDIPYGLAVGSIYTKQATTEDSTTKAEYIAVNEAVWMKNYIQELEAVWMKNYIQKLGVVPSIAEPVVIFYDNNGAIAQAKEPRSHHRSKHILRRYHLLREMVSKGEVRMDRVSSAENTADPLTKPMSQIAHAQHLDKMGLRSMGDWL